MIADAIAATGRLGPAAANDRLTWSPPGEILRDIARGGIAGAIVGIVVGGLGGRLLMRLAAILQGDAVGAMTQNGNRVGDITLVGTLGLIAFGLVSASSWGRSGSWSVPGSRTVPGPGCS